MDDILDQIRQDLKKNISLDQAKARRFFKTSKNDYASNDRFLGIKVPDLRKIALQYKKIDLHNILVLLMSAYNEERLLALFILIHQYQSSDEVTKKLLYNFYLTHIDRINNWNLVDSSAHHIIGDYLYDKDKSILYKLASSESLWQRRISIISTLYFIRKSNLEWTFIIALYLIKDKHDLIHKAVGWMLREAGKKDESQLLSFLSNHSKQMPRTMLRYAIERLSSEKINLFF